MDWLVGVYRAWPWRPHCASAEGRHAWTCRLAHASVLHWSDDCYKPKAGCPDPSRQWTSAGFPNGSRWCPAKDA